MLARNTLITLWKIKTLISPKCPRSIKPNNFVFKLFIELDRFKPSQYPRAIFLNLVLNALEWNGYLVTADCMRSKGRQVSFIWKFYCQIKDTTPQASFKVHNASSAFLLPLIWYLMHFICLSVQMTCRSLTLLSEFFRYTL